MGKTRLVHDWAAGVVASRPVVEVSATASTTTIPFGAFAAWIPDGLEGPLQGVATMRRVADALVGQGAPAVVVDDAHLLDDPSAALVLHLARHTGATVLATVRSGEAVPDAVAALGREPVGTRLDLRDLSAAEVATVVESRLGDRVHPVAHQRVWSLSLGNPMYVREIIDTALSEGHLRREQGTWVWEGDLPGTPRLVELVGQRVGRVDDPDERRALELVAVGEPLPLDLLAQVVPTDRIQALEARRLIALRTLGGRESVDWCTPSTARSYGRRPRPSPPAATTPSSPGPPWTSSARSTPFASACGCWAATRSTHPPHCCWRPRSGPPRCATMSSPCAWPTPHWPREPAPTPSSSGPAVSATWAATTSSRALIEALAADPDPTVRAEAAEMRAFRLVWDHRDTPGALRVLADALNSTPPGPDTRLAATTAAFASHESDIEATLAATARTVSSPGADEALRLRGLTIAGYTAALRGSPARHWRPSRL